MVTRLKENADYGVVEERPVPQKGHVLKDQVIFLHKQAAAGDHLFPAVHRDLGGGPTTGAGIFDQPSGFRGFRDRGHLPGPVADHLGLV